MAGLKSTPLTMSLDRGEEQKYVEELNTFYARFDSFDFSDKVNSLKNDLSNSSNDFKALEIEQHEVLISFNCLKTNKACGPDGLTGRVLKSCARELSFIYTYIFNMSLYMNIIPDIWKTSKITPVPKSNSIKQMNDLRPIALTSLPMKCLEKLILKRILPECQSHLDPYQFAYKAKRSVEDAILYFTNNIYSHLDIPKSYVRSLFIDFSSAFNTIQPHILIPKLLHMGVNRTATQWILNFLTKRPQFVFLKINDCCFSSSVITTDTGAPQGTVLAPILFSIYTNDCVKNFRNIPIIKYADDTSIQALISSETDLLNYENEISRFVKWCDDHFLLLNVKKTKEVIFDFRLKDNVHSNILIKGQEVERVKEYKYLGVVFDEKLDWSKNSITIQKKINQRLFFMKKLFSFNVDKTLLNLFYDSCIVSLFTFCINAWGGNQRANDKAKMNRTIRNANKFLNNCNYNQVDDWLVLSCRRKDVL